MVALVDTASSVAARCPNGGHFWAFVRWLENAPRSAHSRRLRMTRLRWASHSRPPPGATSGRVQGPYYDLVRLSDITGPACLQPDETVDDSEVFFFNHNVR